MGGRRPMPESPWEPAEYSRREIGRASSECLLVGQPESILRDGAILYQGRDLRRPSKGKRVKIPLPGQGV